MTDSDSTLTVPAEFNEWFKTIPADVRKRMSLHQLRWFFEQRKPFELTVRADDEQELEITLKAHKLLAAVDEWFAEIRQKTKYTEEVGSFEESRDMLIECMKEQGVLELRG